MALDPPQGVGFLVLGLFLSWVSFATVRLRRQAIGQAMPCDEPMALEMGGERLRLESQRTALEVCWDGVQSVVEGEGGTTVTFDNLDPNIAFVLIPTRAWTPEARAWFDAHAAPPASLRM